MLLRNKEKRFWKWFISNKTKIEEFMESDLRDNTIYINLTKELHKFDKRIYPEIAKNNENNYVLIITPDGIKAGMEPTNIIVASAPNIDNWKVKKYRQASDKRDLNFNGLDFTYRDIKIWRQFETEEELVHIALFINGYKEEDNRYKNLGFLYLDHILGEYNVLTRVGSIEFFGWDKVDENIDCIDLLTLRKEIEDNLY
jgi:hypothetical protein